MPGKSGNTNALKHGLYAKSFTKSEVAGLRRMPSDDLRQEIALLRVVITRMFTKSEGEKDLELAAKAMNTLSNAITTLNTTIRTHALLTGTYSPLDDALAGALLDEPFFTVTTEQVLP